MQKLKMRLKIRRCNMGGTRQVLIILAAISTVLVMGCAKKHKPDQDVAMSDGPAMDFVKDGSDSGKIDGLYSVHFDFDQSLLSAQDRDLLVKDKQWLLQHPTK